MRISTRVLTPMPGKQSTYSIARGTAAFSASTGAASTASGTGSTRPTAREEHIMVRAIMTLRENMIAWIEKVDFRETRRLVCTQILGAFKLKSEVQSDEEVKMEGDGAPLLYPGPCGMSHIA